MSIIQIKFNNKVWELDTTELSGALARIQEYIVQKIPGNSSTDIYVALNDAQYLVKADKLSESVTAITNHMRSLPQGSGYTVEINDTVYNISQYALVGSADTLGAGLDTLAGLAPSTGLSFRSLSDGTCEVTGIGTCTDTVLRIPATAPSGQRVSRIAKGAFVYNSNITEVVMPEGLTRIEYQAFGGCSNLTTVTIPTSVTSIGNLAFNDTNITGEPNGTAVYVDNWLVSKSVEIYGGDYGPDGYAYGYNYLDSFKIPDGTVGIEDGILYYGNTSESCQDTSIYIPASLKYSVSLDHTVNSPITYIEVSEDHPDYSSLDGVLFNKDKSILINYPDSNSRTEYEIPSTVTTVAENAFSYIAYLQTLIIPVSVTRIEYQGYTDHCLTKLCYRGTSMQWSYATHEFDAQLSDGRLSIEYDYV